MSGSYSHFVRVRGVLRHARVYPGPPEAAPLIVLPGLGCASWMYRRLARQLAQERTVWVYDHPGMGLSQGRPHVPRGIEDLTDHVANWMDVRGMRGVPILGHSLGGEVAIDLAARFPHLPSALILCAPTGIPENPSVVAQLTRLMLDLPRERLGLLPFALSSYLRTGPLRMLRLAQNQSVHETGPLIGLVKCPALVIDGTADPVIRAWTLDLMCERLQDGRALELPGGTHALMDSRPAEIAAATSELLRARS
ncbi:alpha/beta hydrolase [Deinococcus sp. KNUC1210]|uniref:alpha/beta fold hydrolase n=1 Tax=Deinococcus sp. KNUC1210 TaxID=2917691 RepID=UPI001EEFA927|nr:alpha/beta hydrolase [Deinococcus sp. KNUC1210]ULH16126.1 alpha/beta hydrolase [Deinococcus sp. KNUC1210]